MTKEEIEKKVDELLDTADLKVLPINVVALAQYHGFSVFEAKLSEDTSGVIMADTQKIKTFDTNKVILVNHKHSAGRKRFTIAHELGHYFIDGPKNVCFAHRDEGNMYNEEERLANAFASELLMPKEMVKKLYEKLVDRFGNVPDRLLVSQVSMQFYVSEDAARVRLSKLKMI